jgi:chromosome segregation ATPase
MEILVESKNDEITVQSQRIRDLTRKNNDLYTELETQRSQAKQKLDSRLRESTSSLLLKDGVDIDALVKEVAEKNNVVTEARNYIDSMEKEITSIRSDRDQWEERTQKLDQTIRELKRDKEYLVEQMNTLQQQLLNNSGQEQRQQLLQVEFKRTVQRHEEDKNRLRDRIQQLETQLRDQEEDIRNETRREMLNKMSSLQRQYIEIDEQNRNTSIVTKQLEKKQQDLISQIRELDDQIAQQKTTNTRLQTERDNISDQLVASEKDVIEFRQQLKSLNDQINTLTEHRKRDIEDKQELTSKLEQQTVLNSDIQYKLGRIQIEKDNFEIQIKQLKEQKSKITERTNSLEEKIASNTDDIMKYRKDIDTLSREKDEILNEKHKYAVDNGRLQERIKTLEDQVGLFRNKSSTLESDKSNLDQRTSTQKEQIMQLSHTVDNLKERSVHLSGQVQSLTGQLNTCQDTIASLNQQLKEKSQECSRASQEIQNLTAEVHTLEDEQRKSTETIDSLRVQLRSKTNDATRFEQMIKNQREIEHSLQSAQQHINNLEVENNNLSSQLSILRAVDEKQQDKISLLQQEHFDSINEFKNRLEALASSTERDQNTKFELQALKTVFFDELKRLRRIIVDPTQPLSPSKSPSKQSRSPSPTLHSEQDYFSLKQYSNHLESELDALKERNNELLNKINELVCRTLIVLIIC